MSSFDQFSDEDEVQNTPANTEEEKTRLTARLLALTGRLKRHGNWGSNYIAKVARAVDRLDDAVNSLEDAGSTCQPERSRTNSQKNLRLGLPTYPIEKHLGTILKEFEARIEETKHVHDLAILATERAAQRIVELESNCRDLEQDLETDRTELSFLKLQLKILEIQASRYIPEDDEDDLIEAIERWKLDWKDVDQRLKCRQEIRAARSETSDKSQLEING